MTSTAFAHRPGRGLTDDWLTPPELLRLFPTFDLDPFCPPNVPWKTAKRMICQPSCGFVADWGGPDVRVWCNPPYSQIGASMAMMADHGNGMALIFARTETQWFFETVWQRAQAILFLRGRLHFHNAAGERAKGNAGGPHVLVAYGTLNVIDLYNQRQLGRYLEL